MASLDRLKTSIKDVLTRTVWSYDGDALVRTLAGMGVVQGDTLMVHSSWLAHNGFRGKASDAVASLKRVVGPSGLLVMPSLPYHNMSTDRKSTRLNSSHTDISRMPSSA